MKLTDFSHEILLQVISNIPLNSDLAKVTLVSHRFNDLAETLLYRNIHFDAEPLEECQLGYIPTLKRTDQLIANLKARPELGRYTTAFSLRVTHPLWYQSYPQLSIIRRMPGLRQLSYDPPAVHGGGIPTENKKLTALRFDFSHVTNHYYDDGGLLWLELGIPLEVIARDLWHPSLRKLQAEKIFFGDKFEPEPWLGQRRMRQGRSPVEDLRFLDCFPHIDGKGLNAFINAIRHLKCFVLEIESPKDPLVVPNTLAPEVEIRPALLAHRATIEELAISTTNHALRCYSIVHAPGSFVQWNALKRLAMPEVMLSRDLPYHVMLHVVLPPQLEELQLEKKLWTVSAQGVDRSSEESQLVTEKDLTLFKELAKNKEMCVPGLKRLIWWLQHASSRNFSDSDSGPTFSVHAPMGKMDALESILKKVGVQFEWVQTALFKDTPFSKRLYEW